jgi:hypothetical protein
VDDYLKAGRLTGVRADLAFAQSVVETGYFSFPAGGQDARGYNNFAGIGACDSCKHGWKFPSALAGVLGQELLLDDYASPPQQTAGGPSGSAPVGVQGCCTTWMALSGVWASNPNYGYEILSVYKMMLDWALQSQLQKAGLAQPFAVAPPGSPAPATSVVAGTAVAGTPNQPERSLPAPSRSPQT